MTKKETAFITTVWKQYRTEGRMHLPWRKTTDPYKIFVSEIMLQQTQVDRVLPKYKLFLQKFPNMRLLCEASLGDVLRVWQGLGYNRRAKMLLQCAKHTAASHNGKLPKDYKALLSLPGIGPYTAGAILIFSHNIPVPIIETNIRTVYLYHFFKNSQHVDDKDLLEIITRTLDRNNPREWYWALMDYGSQLKRKNSNLNKQSKHYTKQSTFLNSNRQIRGGLIKMLAESRLNKRQLLTGMNVEKDRIMEQLNVLVAEGLIDKQGTWYSLPA